MQNDIQKFLCVLIVAAVFGYTVGQVTLSVLIAALGIIAWQAYQFNVLSLWVENPKANPIPLVHGQLYNLYRSINRNNTKYTKRKRQLSTYLTQFRKAVGALPDAIILIDDHGKIEWANKNANAVLGIRWPQDNNVRFGDLIRYPEVDDILEDANSAKNISKQGVVVSSVSDAEHMISFKCVRYTSDLRMVIARDVSRLIKVNQMHTDFVANVSHELKTPLTVLKGYVEILRDEPELPASFIKPLAQMHLQNVRMEHIVGDLLYLAKLEDTENIETHHRVNVAALVNTIVQTLHPLIEEKQHTLKLDIDHTLSLVGAQTELHSAFSNLITNAINYTPENGVITVRWTKNTYSTVFSVKDSGYGVAAHHLERLTQRFYRVDPDRSRGGGGTGLGLSIVKHVLQRHGAELEIDSKEGGGSQFSCVFPTDKQQLNSN
jgi:two-component system phosphate regulon sensor histidine kinase PhoR